MTYTDSDTKFDLIKLTNPAATLAAVETCFLKNCGEEVDLSEQQLLDCAICGGCQGCDTNCYAEWILEEKPKERFQSVGVSLN